MVFVTVDENRAQLENLTKLLIRTFPGSVIYQYTDPTKALRSCSWPVSCRAC